MTWLAGQQRALDRIEKTLVAGDYRLASRFAFSPGWHAMTPCLARNGSRHGRAGRGRLFLPRPGWSP